MQKLLGHYESALLFIVLLYVCVQRVHVIYSHLHKLIMLTKTTTNSHKRHGTVAQIIQTNF